MEWYLPVIWAGLIGTAVILYVVTDGFDLGIGILFPFTRSERQRDVMMNSVAPFWDGNETWLVLGGGGLWVAFPKAYATIMPALYLPIIIMLLALIFRGVAFEFRWIAKPHHRWWDIAFIGGSTVAAFAQGLVLGGLIQGIKIENGQFAGGPFDWLSPFSVFCGFALIGGYALLGACWLMMKTEGEVERRARHQAGPLLLIVLAAMAVVSLWTPLFSAEIAERWFTLPNFFFLAPVPLLTAALAFLAWRGIDADHSATPFFATMGLFVLGFLGLAISWFPYLVPPTLTIWDTAAAPASQIFVLFGAIALLPLILGYNVFLHWVFRGKVREGEGYH
jgi:cytochrome d ubiquinol oxidase subunit II